MVSVSEALGRALHHPAGSSISEAIRGQSSVAQSQARKDLKNLRAAPFPIILGGAAAAGAIAARRGITPIIKKLATGGFTYAKSAIGKINKLTIGQKLLGGAVTAGTIAGGSYGATGELPRATFRELVGLTSFQINPLAALFGAATGLARSGGKELRDLYSTFRPKAENLAGQYSSVADNHLASILPQSFQPVTTVNPSSPNVYVTSPQAPQMAMPSINIGGGGGFASEAIPLTLLALLAGGGAAYLYKRRKKKKKYKRKVKH